MIKIFRTKHIISAAIILAALFVSYRIVARAQSVSGVGGGGEVSANVDVSADAATDEGEASASVSAEGQVNAASITFPIPELGNCTSKNTCREYCNDPAHMDACIAFAQAHGLMNKDDVSRANKFKQALQSGGGPGGCTNPRDCGAYCSDATHIEACVSFAKSHGIKDKNVDDGEKILAHLKAGGHMPGDCTTKENCEAYCNNFSHYQECYNWSKATGVRPATGGPRDVGGGVTGQGLTADQLQKLSDLMNNGQTPGGCKSKDECEKYCGDQSHRDECVNFAVQAGFMTQEQADKIKSGGGNGPGGCNSPESCRAYCDTPEHREDCFKFAEEHGYMRHEDVEHAKEGFVRMRAGLEQAPPEVQECIKAAMGENVIDDIQSGKLVPGPEIGERVRTCFEKFGKHADAGEMFSHIPPQVLSCLKEKLGDKFDDLKSGKTQPTPEIADSVRVCFQSQQFQGGFQGGPNGPNGGQGGERGHMGGPSPEMVKHFLMSAPPEIQACLKDALGDDFAKIENGEQVQFDTSKMKSCFEKFRPQGFGSGTQGGMQGGMGGGFGGGRMINNMPPEVLDCLKANVGADVLAKIQSGDTASLGADASVSAAMRSCFEKFKSSGGGSPGGPGPGGEPPIGSYFPPQVVACANRVLGGVSGLAMLKSGQLTADQKAQISACMSEVPGQSWTFPSHDGATPPPSGEYQQYPSPSGTTQPPPGATCPSGQHWNGTSCATQTSDPATKCAQYGGTWTGTTCQMPSSATPPPPPGSYPPPPPGATPPPSCPSGSYWNGTSCVTSGTGTPPPPTTPPQSSISSGSLLGNIFTTLGQLVRFLFR